MKKSKVIINFRTKEGEIKAVGRQILQLKNKEEGRPLIESQCCFSTQTAEIRELGTRCPPGKLVQHKQSEGDYST